MCLLTGSGIHHGIGTCILLTGAHGDQVTGITIMVIIIICMAITTTITVAHSSTVIRHGAHTTIQAAYVRVPYML